MLSLEINKNIITIMHLQIIILNKVDLRKLRGYAINLKNMQPGVKYLLRFSCDS